ncbi:DGQHR domain-containing protein [Methylobacillus sp. Pita2]|uniref:DGQHR domain-containing protein n=1 Tax=Methylobacillus sp. Pita2 TaxID=3383245 RepID=UPI0038B574C9
MDPLPVYGSEQRISVSQVRQGDHRFFTFTIESDLLAKCCFATTKEEDTLLGFQRVLDLKRAQAIADYIDNGLGTIPNSIVLSAQPEAKFKLVDRGKTISFIFDPHSFLIIDGQHRVFGFALARKQMRIPVVVYDNLTKAQEAQLFIDINTKQKPVPKELILAIKSLAASNSDEEALLGEVFDLYDQDESSALAGLTSPTKASSTKLSRVTFNAAFKPLLTYWKENKSSYDIYTTTNSFFHAVTSGLRNKKIEKAITNKTTFRAFATIFPDCISRVQDKHGKQYTPDNFSRVIKPIFEMKSSTFTNPSGTHTSLANDFLKAMKVTLSI